MKDWNIYNLDMMYEDPAYEDGEIHLMISDDISGEDKAEAATDEPKEEMAESGEDKAEAATDEPKEEVAESGEDKAEVATDEPKEEVVGSGDNKTEVMLNESTSADQMTSDEAEKFSMQTKIIQSAYSDMRKDLPDFRSGDTVSVGYRVIEGSRSRVQDFEGVVIKISSGHGLDKTFTVRKISSGVGVERIFPFHSPNIETIKLLKKGKVRRAKLYYLRSRKGKAARIKERI